MAQYTRYLARDLRPHGIRVNSVTPGPIGTARLRVRYRGGRGTRRGR
ncbi:SDR family oxidoreductase [Lentzea xinjiangensis]